MAAADNVRLGATTDLLWLGHPSEPGPLQVPPLGSVDTGYSSPSLHPMLSHQPCLSASLTPPSLVDQRSRQAGDVLLLFWAGLLSTPPSSLPTPEQEEGKQHGVPVHPCTKLGRSEGAGWGAAIEQREAGAVEGRQGGLILLALVLSQPCWHVLPVSAHTWEHQQLLPCSGRGSVFLRSQSGLLGGGRAILFFLKPLHCTHHH